MSADNRNFDQLYGVIIGACRTGHGEIVIEADRKHLPKVLKKLAEQQTQVCGAGKVVYESRLNHYLWDFSHLD